MILHLRAAVEQLYAVPPPEFTPLRTRLAKEAKGAGEVALAASVAALRKPTVAAWAVNHFVREHGARLDDLRAFAELLREAQRTLDADQLRTLGRERASRVDAVAEQIGEEARAAGHPLGAGVALEVRETLTALVSDEAAEASVLTGALVRSLAYSGFGSVDIDDVVAIDDPDLAADARPSRPRPALSVLQGGRSESDQPVRGHARGADSAGSTNSTGSSGASSDDDEPGTDDEATDGAEAAAAAEAAAVEAAAVEAAAARAVAAAAAERTRLSSRLEQARATLRAADRKAAVLEARQEEVQEGIADLERRLATARARLEKVTGELAAADGIRDRAQRQHDDLAAALVELETDRPEG